MNVKQNTLLSIFFKVTPLTKEQEWKGLNPTTFKLRDLFKRIQSNSIQINDPAGHSCLTDTLPGRYRGAWWTSGIYEAITWKLIQCGSEQSSPTSSALNEATETGPGIVRQLVFVAPHIFQHIYRLLLYVSSLFWTRFVHEFHLQFRKAKLKSIRIHIVGDKCHAPAPPPPPPHWHTELLSCLGISDFWFADEYARSLLIG